MSLFSLPLDPSSRHSSSRVHLQSRTLKKRKRFSSPHVEFVDEINLTDSEYASEKPLLSAASTNPLSLNPDEIQQYKLAGLELSLELPSKSIADFPHRRVPPNFPPDLYEGVAYQKDGNSAGAELGSIRQEGKGPHLRMQHFSVLTTILHRCLLEGDIPRASRAWALLMRAQHNGRGVDIRSLGYWGIGAELLISGGEKLAQQRGTPKDGRSTSPESVIEESAGHDEPGLGDDKKYKISLRRWGMASGLEKAKDYYERLILQYPFKRQYPDSVSSLDFWPAMLSCEIYGIQFEQLEAMRKIAVEEESDDDVMAEASSDEDENLTSNDPDIYFAAQLRREAHQRVRKQDIIWEKRDHCRETALIATEKIAGRMDELMTAPPYSDSHVLHRLRGMLALYVGDLSIPALFDAESEEEQEQEHERQDPNDAYHNDYAGNGRLTERRLLQRNRRAEHERGLAKRMEEWARARKAFEKIQREGGVLGGVVDMARLASVDF